MWYLLQVIGLSSAENEYYSIAEGSCAGLGLQLLLRAWVVNTTVRIASDSSAERRFTSSHVETRNLWTHEQLPLDHTDLDTVASNDNCNGLLTHILSNDDFQRDMKAMDQEFRERRAMTGKQVLIGDDNVSIGGN